ncbi:MAG: SDR family oxidoreductase [Gammaproteobacteria bacterium]|nr:SDR family oxidoreductase [Gammaproteobacteria bacterium]
MNSTRIIIGCGYVGQYLAHAEMAADHSVNGFATHADKAQQLSQQGIDCGVLNLDDANTVAPNLKQRVVHYHVPPPSSGRVDLRVSTFINLIDKQPLPKRIVLISTTGVYGHVPSGYNTDGRWVTEAFPTNPQSDRARCRLSAEQQFSTWCQHNHVELVVLRVPGIYGPGRTPEARLSKPVVCKEEAPFSNRIHVHDLVNACARAASIESPLPLYNVSDGQPSTMTEYFNAVADHAHLPRPKSISLEQAKSELSPAMLSYLSESRRIDNTLMREHLGVRLRFPDLASGLADCFKQQDSHH